MTNAANQPLGPTSSAAAEPPGSGQDDAVDFDASDPTAKLDVAAAKVAAAEEQARTSRDQMLRVMAEMENMRKRAQRDIESANRYGLEKVALELLPVKDSLDLAIDNEARADAASLIEGTRATLALLAKAFEKLQVVEIDPRGEPFDPAQHEALTVQESATAEPNSVLAVVQKGYALNGRLLRPARVIVTKAPS